MGSWRTVALPIRLSSKANEARTAFDSRRMTNPYLVSLCVAMASHGASVAARTVSVDNSVWRHAAARRARRRPVLQRLRLGHRRRGRQHRGCVVGSAVAGPAEAFGTLQRLG